jgi:hypothetical protein
MHQGCVGGNVAVQEGHIRAPKARTASVTRSACLLLSPMAGPQGTGQPQWGMASRTLVLMASNIVFSQAWGSTTAIPLAISYSGPPALND